MHILSLIGAGQILIDIILFFLILAMYKYVRHFSDDLENTEPDNYWQDMKRHSASNDLKKQEGL